MYWCLRVKLAQNFITFGQLLEKTCDKAIVEDSSKDAFWGAVKDKKDETILIGVNALGRLLMKLRQDYNSANRFDLLFVEPLSIPNFSLYDVQIQVVDERQTFIDNLQKHWMLKPKQQINEHITFKTENTYLNGTPQQVQQSIVSEPETNLKKPKKTKNQNFIQSQLPLT